MSLDESPLLDPHHIRESLAMVHRAMKQGWDVPQGVRDELPGIVAEIAKNKDSAERDKLRAVECLMAMGMNNIKAAETFHKMALMTIASNPDKPAANDVAVDVQAMIEAAIGSDDNE
jgi:hypothetical protein